MSRCDATGHQRCLDWKCPEHGRGSREVALDLDQAYILHATLAGYLDEARRLVGSMSLTERNRLACAARLLASLCDMVNAHQELTDQS